MVQKNPIVIANNYMSEFLSQKMNHNAATFPAMSEGFDGEKVAVT
jgi:hypothetical protein